MIRRISAAILLLVLLVVPFFNWQLGLLLWLGAWIMFIVQKLFDRQSWNLGQPGEENHEDEKEEPGSNSRGKQGGPPS
jgi:hypothetical protein